jgi:centromere protein C
MLTLSRKTGITLKDTGVRDEQGLEPLDGIFSSPEKSAMKTNSNGANGHTSEGDDMDIGDSEIAHSSLS